MKSEAEIFGGSQRLLDISFDIQDVFEDFLTDQHRLFLSELRVIEESIPPLSEAQAKTERKAYPMIPFIRAFHAKSFYKLESNKDLIVRL